MGKSRLLIVDDEKYLSLLYKEELSEEGYFVDVANSIHEARKLLEMNSYHLLIVEAKFNREEGCETFYTLVNNKSSEMPVIVNTGINLSEYNNKFNSFRAYIEKSSDLSILKEKVHETLNGISLMRQE